MEEENTANKNIKTWLKLFFFIVGLGFLAITLYKTGLTPILQTIEKVGWFFVPIIFMNLTWYLADSIGWHYLLNRSVPIKTLLFAQTCGEAINNATPFMNLGGEPIKGMLVSGLASKTEVISTLIVDNTIRYITGISFMSIGFLLSIIFLKIPYELRLGLGVCLSVTIAGVSYLIFAQKKGLLGSLFSALNFLKFPRLLIKDFDNKKEKVKKIDTAVYELYSKSKRNFYLSFLFHFLSRVICIFDAILILYILNYKVTFLTAVFIQTINVLLNTVFTFIPLTIGVAEGSHYIIFNALTLAPAVGVVFSLIRRIRGIVWIGIGLLLLAIPSTKKEREYDKRIYSEV